MNKRAVEEYMRYADKAINEELSGEVDKSIRSKMSAFGATVIMTGLLPALTYYKCNAEKVYNLLNWMYQEDSNKDTKEDTSKENANNKNSDNILYNKVKAATLGSEDEVALKEKVLAYSVALKLVMNMYIKEEKETTSGN